MGCVARCAVQWLQATDPDSGKCYYYHVKTHEVVWDAPAGLPTQRYDDLVLQHNKSRGVVRDPKPTKRHGAGAGAGASKLKGTAGASSDPDTALQQRRTAAAVATMERMVLGLEATLVGAVRELTALKAALVELQS